MLGWCSGVGSGVAGGLLPACAPLPSVAQTLALWRWPHGYLEGCRARFGERFTIYPAGAPPIVFLADPEDIRAVARAPVDVLCPGAGASVLAPLVGERSYMLADGEDHERVRRQIAPALRKSCVAAHAEMLEEITTREVSRWPVGRPFASHPLLRSLTLKVVLRMLFGEWDPRVGELHCRLLRMLAVTRSVALQEPQVRLLPPWRGLWQRTLRERAHIHGLLDELIAEYAKAEHGEGLLSCLGEACADGLGDNVMSLIVAGHETTSSELAWAFQLLAHNPRVSGRLTRSIDRGEEDYLTATVQEVLRHRPVFLTMIPRVVNEPWEHAGRVYPAGVQLAGAIHLMHHNRRHYPDPEAFKPERFLDAGPLPSTWRPWGAGRKHCPGRHLAFLEIQTVLRTVLTTYTIAPARRKPESARWRSVIVTPSHGSRITVQKRQNTR